MDMSQMRILVDEFMAEHAAAKAAEVAAQAEAAAAAAEAAEAAAAADAGADIEAVVAASLAYEDADIDENAPVQELIALLEQRMGTYGFLARLYYQEVDQAFLDEMHGGLYPVETGDPDTDTGYLYIATFLSNLWTESLHDLSIDFSRSFFGDGVDSYSAAYPYESVYTSEKRLMMERARSEVYAIYLANGIKKTEAWKEGEDHIALEMEFERIICSRCIEALEGGDEEEAYRLLRLQYDFLRNHLTNWVPMMTRDLRRFANTKFYQGLAYLTDGFLRTDLQFLKNLLFDDEEADDSEVGENAQA